MPGSPEPRSPERPARGSQRGAATPAICTCSRFRADRGGDLSHCRLLTGEYVLAVSAVRVAGRMFRASRAALRSCSACSRSTLAWLRSWCANLRSLWDWARSRAAASRLSVAGGCRWPLPSGSSCSGAPRPGPGPGRCAPVHRCLPPVVDGANVEPAGQGVAVVGANVSVLTGSVPLLRCLVGQVRLG